MDQPISADFMYIEQITSDADVNLLCDQNYQLYVSVVRRFSLSSQHITHNKSLLLLSLDHSWLWLRERDRSGTRKQVVLVAWVVFFRRSYVCVGTVENHDKNGKKHMVDFCKNHKNHGKNRASNHRPKDHYTFYKSQHLALSTITASSTRFFHL